MQVRLVFAVAIYLASYLPLSLILLMQDIDYSLVGKPLCFDLSSATCRLPIKSFGPAALGVSVCCAGLIVTLVALKALQPKDPIQLTSSKHVPADLMNYVLPYVVSFMGLTYADADKLIGFIVFLGWIFLITYKSGQIIMNPLLTVFGWRLYEIEYTYPGGTKPHASYCLSQQAIASGETHPHTSFQDVLIIKRATHAPGS